MLGDKPFKLITDHEALQYAFKKNDLHGRLDRWLDFLADYKFKVVYRPGAENGAADFPSRVDDRFSETSTDEIVGPVFCSGDYSGVEDDLQALAAYLSGKPSVIDDPYKRRGMK